MGFGKRIVLAFRIFFYILIHGELPAELLRDLRGATASASAVDVAAVATPVRKEQSPAAESCDRAVQMLAILQRDGRLVDFLSEDVSLYPDAQLGAAVRMIHDSCKQALERYVTLEPILASEEDQPVTLQAGFDPASVKLIGNVMGAPPLRGLLRHRGWRAKEVRLPSLAEGTGRSVVAPAEVEIP
jgi:hypothetical protein